MYARNLGVLLDSCLIMKDHISEVSKLAFYHLRNISHIRKYLTLSAAKTIVHALVCSRIDANNALYFGLPVVQIKKLQRMQNAAARVILRRRKYDHVTPALENYIGCLFSTASYTRFLSLPTRLFTDKLHHISQLYFGIKCVHPMA